MKPGYTADIGLEVHAELQTNSKMFCACPVVDLTLAQPNSAVCPVCAGMPGALPVVNQQAVAMALQVALAMECEVMSRSQFARKNYFYPDLPKGYQISQYEFPLALCGNLPVRTEQGWITVRVRRVHLEEDTAKLTHIHETNGDHYSLVDLNRAGIPLLEIVSEPDMHSIDQVHAYTRALRILLQYLEVNSGDLEKGVIRFEANVSVRPAEQENLGTRVEIKNLNSFRNMMAAIAYEMDRQVNLLEAEGAVMQETLGWDEIEQVTFSQRSKEEAHDYRYFPEPDLPPLYITSEQIAAVQANLPERPDRRFQRFVADFGLDPYLAEILTGKKFIADYFEAVLTQMTLPDAVLAANWIVGELFSLMNAAGETVNEISVFPVALASLLDQLQHEIINPSTAKIVLAQTFHTGKNPDAIVREGALEQISDRETLSRILEKILATHPEEVAAFRSGKTALRAWFFGQVMQHTGGKANPSIVQTLLDENL